MAGPYPQEATVTAGPYPQEARAAAEARKKRPFNKNPFNVGT